MRQHCELLFCQPQICPIWNWTRQLKQGLSPCSHSESPFGLSLCAWSKWWHWQPSVCVPRQIIQHKQCKVFLKLHWNKQWGHTQCQMCYESVTKMSSQCSLVVAFHFIQSHKQLSVSECEHCVWVYAIIDQWSCLLYTSDAADES